MKKNILVLLVIFAGLFYLKGFFKNNENNKNTDKIKVFASIMPQKYFVEKIGGDRVEVKIMVGPGKSPATYEPEPNQVVDLSSSQIFFIIGVPFEKAFLKKISANLQNTKIIDSSKGIKRRYLEKHSHDENEEKHNEIKIEDPHIWLSPSLVKIQGKNIYEALVEADPQGKAKYEEGYNALIKEMDELNLYLKEKLSPYKDSTIFVYHPSFGYFTDEYGLHQEAVETGGKEPVPAILESIIKEALEDKVKIIFVQPEFSQKSAEAIAKGIGGRVVSLNPLNPDYINNMKAIADEIEGALKNDGKL